MAFSLNGTHIEGSTFNSVSGNMSQVFNSYVAPVGQMSVQEAGEDHRLVEGSHAFPAMGGSIGPIRSQRGLKNQDTRPYEVPHPGNQHQSPGNHYIAATESATASADNGDHQSLAAVYSSQFQWPTQNYNTSPGLARPIENVSNMFNSVGGDMTQLSVTSYGESGIDLLYRYVAMEALHDSEECFPGPACHPGTRTAILEDLRSWSTDTSPESTILWLHGCAGVGKSAIAQMFAGSSQSEGRVGASFFFKRGHAKRGTSRSLIPTIAYQVATSVPQILLPMQQAVERDRLVVGRALKVQQEILRLFIRAIRDHKLPIRLLIASRPEPHLTEILKTEDTLAICRQYLLSGDRSAYEDVRKYLGDEFSRIHSDFMGRGIDLGPAWPSPDAVRRLVTMSSGTFIHAATVIRFIDDEYHHPADRLESVLKLDPQSTAPLDDLYTEIISGVPQEQQTQQLRILHVISRGGLGRDGIAGMDLDPENIDMLLHLRDGTCRLILRRLHSLLDVPRIRTRFGLRNPISILHASFRDYLSDARRSGRWCISVPWLPPDWLHYMLHLLSTPPQTDSQRDFYRFIVYHLPAALRNASPTDTVIDLLRNRNVQKGFFLNLTTSPLELPQRDSLYPSDLVQLWEDQKAIVELLLCLIIRKDRSDRNTATFKYDQIYNQIFSRNPDLLLVTQCGIVNPNLRDHLELFDCTSEIFRPFLQFSELFPLPFPDGDSPLDFLTDPCRAGGLYSEPCHIAEGLLLRWLCHAKRVLVGGPCELYPNYLDLIKKCRASSRILRELETFNLAAFCGQMSIDSNVHRHFHRFTAKEHTLCNVVKWLRSFPEAPSPWQAIEFWERQINDIRRCTSGQPPLNNLR
ncbi:hypothetical protein B0H16DRAFT_1696780 [Mycena metata]|uniref:Nephrocystin 3-like N-terminal domain-containing protein n=1 Tax=Mycena metata TaxID=1033252 RepID=A0AAD7HYG5_9AGAR|nr:hypothetical protein B0H16DRAFT_1696780 [Mycena metata]